MHAPVVMFAACSMVPVNKGSVDMSCCAAQNRRPDYLTTVVEEMLNWDFASKNFAA